MKKNTNNLNGLTYFNLLLPSAGFNRLPETVRDFAGGKFTESLKIASKIESSQLEIMKSPKLIYSKLFIEIINYSELSKDRMLLSQ